MNPRVKEVKAKEDFNLEIGFFKELKNVSKFNKVKTFLGSIQ